MAIDDFSFLVAGMIIRLRRATTEEWIRVNPVLKNMEPGFDKDLRIIKRGDGRTPWSLLPVYATLTPLFSPCPECEAGKCSNCDGTSWDNAKDDYIPCPCFIEDHPRRTV